MRALAWTEHLIYDSRIWRFVAAVVAIGLVKTGIWYIPNLGASLEIAQDPFRNPFSDPDAHYLFWSWLGPFLAWIVRANAQWSFLLFHLAFTVAFTLLFVRVVLTRFSDRHARTAIILFTILPATATVYFWVGYDSITLFLMLVALAVPDRAVVTLLAGIGVGMQNFEQGLFAAAGLFLAVFLVPRFGTTIGYRRSFCAYLLVGVVLGKLVLLAVVAYYAIDVNSGRIYWLVEHLGDVLGQFFFHAQWIVYSALGLGWLVAIRYLDWGRRSIPFFVALVGLCLLLPISEDQTRVLAVVSFPLVAVFWLFNEEFLNAIASKETALVAILWVVLPMSWVWQGLPRWSVLPYDIAYGLHVLFGWFNVPASPALWPFQP